LTDVKIGAQRVSLMTSCCNAAAAAAAAADYMMSSVTADR